MRIHADCPLLSVEQCHAADHSWHIFATLAHARLFSENEYGVFSSEILTDIQAIGEFVYRIRVSTDFRWSDGQVVSAIEVVVALRTAEAMRRLKLFESVRALSSDVLTIEMPPNRRLTPALLASPIFFLTPTCRFGTTRLAHEIRPTSGRFYVDEFREDGSFSRLILNPRLKNRVGVEVIEFAMCESYTLVEELIMEKNFDLTSPLGGPDSARLSWNTVSNRIVAYGMALTPLTPKTFRSYGLFFHQIDKLLDRKVISLASDKTYIPMYSIETLFFGADEHVQSDLSLNDVNSTVMIPKKLTLCFVDFFPNRQVVVECANQIERLFGITVDIETLDYTAYRNGEIKQDRGPALLLEIVKPVLPIEYYKKSRKIALCQAITTAISDKPIFKNISIFTKDALINWQALSV